MRVPPQIITDKLRDFEGARMRVATLRGCGEAILLFCAGIAAVVLLEALLKPSKPWRTALTAVLYFSFAAWLCRRAWLPWLRKRKLRDVAWGFEHAAGDRFEERIISAVELAESEMERQPGISSWMVARTIQLAEEEIRGVDARALIKLEPAIVAWKRATAGLAVVLAGCLIPGIASRALLALDPSGSTLVLSNLQLRVDPGDCRIRQGTPLEITASGNNLPETLKTRVRWDDGFQEIVAMQHVATNRFTLRLPSVSQGFRYSVQAADAESAVFSVNVEVPPRIAHMQLQIEPPAYPHWTNRTVEGGSADFLEGSRVRLMLETADEKVTEADWISDYPQLRRFKVEDTRLALDLQPTNPVTYQVKLTGANKLELAPAQRWTLRPLPDQPPTVQLAAVGAEPGLVQRDEVLPLQAQASDDVGLKRVDLLILSKDSQSETRNLYPAAPGGALRDYRAAVNFNLADLTPVAGDEVQFQLLATDLRDQTTRAEPISFTVGAADKTLEAQAAARLRLVVSSLAEQIEFLQQTRSSWLSITRNFREDDPAAQGPALTVLRSRLNEFAREIDNIGRRLVVESETNNLPEGRFIYRLGSTIGAWGGQQKEVLLGNCSQLEQARGTNVFNNSALGRELFSRAVLDLEVYHTVVAVLEGAFETDVLATRCESAQSRYKRALPVFRGENVVAPLGQSGSGLMASFFEGTNLNGKLLEKKVSNPRFDNYAPANRREYWSCRYQGELNIAEEADWTLACIANDGVRLLLDGVSVLPQDSWSSHAATQFKTDLKLKAGWHPVIIEFFQGGGNAKLQLLAGKKGAALQEVPAQWLRPPGTSEAQPSLAANAALSPFVKEALRGRVRSSLSQAATVPAAVAPMTNHVRNENLARLVREKFPVSETLSSNLLSFAAWKPDQSRDPEAKADDLTGAAKTAGQILKEELEKYRWRYEGAAALKNMQNAIEELRQTTEELRRLPHYPGNKRTEQEQAEVLVARIWQKELQRATAETAHQFFETAKQKEATLAQRAAALNAAIKTEEQMEPSVKKLASALDQARNKDEIAGAVEQQLNEISNRYRELNELQEKINREDIAAQARKALPPARAFVRAQQAPDPAATQSRYEAMKLPVSDVVNALRVAGDYAEAQKLQARAGETAVDAKGKETAQQLRELAGRTDNNIQSFAQSIPPPMRQQTESLAQHKTTPEDSANSLARPRLAMSLESARLAQQGDRKTGAAYGLLGEDLGALLEKPDSLASATLQPLAERAAALAGEKGEEARQAEIRAANERLRQMAATDPNNAEALANRLEGASTLARQAAGEAPKRQPLDSELGEMSKLAAPEANWAESTDPREIAAGAAHESANEIKAAPDKWEPYNAASEMLADAARQIRSDSAATDLAALNPFPEPPSAAEAALHNAAATLETNGDQQGMVGKAITQPPPKGLDQAEWARLAQRLRDAIRSSGIESFSQEHQAAIRAYFERLSTDNQKSNR